MLSREGREDHSNKSQLSDVLKILMVNNGVQLSRNKSSRNKETGKKYCTGRTFQQ